MHIYTLMYLNLNNANIAFLMQVALKLSLGTE